MKKRGTEPFSSEQKIACLQAESEQEKKGIQPESKPDAKKSLKRKFDEATLNESSEESLSHEILLPRWPSSCDDSILLYEDQYQNEIV